MFVFTKSTLYKIFYLNVLSSYFLLFIVILGSFNYNNFYFDIALIYVMFSFGANIGIKKYYKNNEVL